jgi:gamma-D-glutamyl-L-lysine dipeptidyl-peptidase
LLFGETYAIVEETEDWLQIKTNYDGYPCWINNKQHTFLKDSEFKSLIGTTLSSELVQVVNQVDNSSVFPITIGATLPNFKNGKCGVGNCEFSFEGQTSDSTVKKLISDIQATAYLFLNAPYLWGGRSPFGIDCSGFTQLVYKLNGYQLPRDACQQVEIGSPLSFVEEAKAGDLAFFDNEDGNIVHVGIVLENQQIIHASGCVRIDRFDHYGIFHSDNKKYSHMLRVIKKII